MLAHGDVEAAPEGAAGEPGADWRSVFGSIAHRARAAALQAVPRSEELTVPLAAGAEPNFEPGEEEPRWTMWAKQAAGRVRQQAAEAAGQAQRGISMGVEKVKAVDWGEQVKGVQDGVTRSLERVSDGASSATASIQETVTQGVERANTADWVEHAQGLRRGFSHSLEIAAASASSSAVALQERGQAAQEMAREYSGKGMQALGDNLTVATSSARGALSVASERVSGAATLAMSPKKLAQFAGVFFAGSLLIALSLNFLPILLIAPQKFALLFTVGSLTLLGSFAMLNGLRSFAASLSRRDKLPFSSAYVLGLVGTLWATLVRRSYVFTTVFAIMQAVALLYFVASYLPGGRSALNVFGRIGARSARTLLHT
mmetsp:Transcript_54542/g.152117  ORF Transcript_54542/g.152117 Transcript_54542/m.152117 type:complete len:372 (-) Transcript_54542:62-1177(-)